jgi:hypothetical protein
MPTRLPPASADAPTLVAAYRETAIKWSAAVDDADSRTANRHFDRMTTLGERLAALSDGPAALAALMDDPHTGVRLQAACHSYLNRQEPAKAEHVLMELDALTGHVAVGASSALFVWKLGRYRTRVH